MEINILCKENVELMGLLSQIWIGQLVETIFKVIVEPINIFFLMLTIVNN